MSTDTLFNDPDVRLELLGMSIWDQHWLRACVDLVTADDFRPIVPGMNSFAHIIAGISFEFYRKHRIPIGSVMGQELKKWCLDSGASDARREDLKKYVKRLKTNYDPSR